MLTGKQKRVSCCIDRLATVVGSIFCYFAVRNPHPVREKQDVSQGRVVFCFCDILWYFEDYPPFFLLVRSRRRRGRAECEVGSSMPLDGCFLGVLFMTGARFEVFMEARNPSWGEYGACGKGGISTMKTLLQVLVRRGSVELGAGWG